MVGPPHRFDGRLNAFSPERALLVALDNMFCFKQSEFPLQAVLRSTDGGVTNIGSFFFRRHHNSQQWQRQGTSAAYGDATNLELCFSFTNKNSSHFFCIVAYSFLFTGVGHFFDSNIAK